MTVAETIEKLKTFDPDAQVVYGHRRCGETVQVIYATVPFPSRVVLS